MDNSEESIREGIKYLSDIVEGKVSLQEKCGLRDEDVNALLQLGALLYNQGRREEAEDLFRGAVLLNKNNSLAHSALGTVLTAEGKNEEALVVLNEALRLDPNDVAARVNRAECLLKNAQFEEASMDLRRAIELDPSESDPAANRARAIVIGMTELVKELQKRLAEEQEQTY